MIGPLVIILDASVVIAWYLDLPESDKAREMIPDVHAVYAAPDILLHDVADALGRSGAYTVQEVSSISDRLRADLVLEPISGRMLKAATAWMCHYDLPLRSVLPLALAREAGAPLLTCDAHMVQTLRDSGAYELVREVVLLGSS